MAGKGGARPGAGRKPTRERFAPAVEKAEKRIADHLPALVDRMFELASGVLVQGEGTNGEVKVYEKPPDYRAASYLMDRIMGKPMQTVEQDTTYRQDPAEGTSDDVLLRELERRGLVKRHE